MLSREDNELLARVGPGTPMGAVMRQYWQPILLSRELESDGPPVRVRALGEDLIAFKDTEGRIGLLEANCPHRGAPLFFARNEAAGLRCIYHGWKFDVEGRCVDMPNVPQESNFKDRVRAPSYKAIERNGIIWGYLGEGSPPPLPSLEWTELDSDHAYITKQLLECNYAQALEGDFDPSHISFLHAPHDAMEIDPELQSRLSQTTSPYERENIVRRLDKHPTIAVLNTDYGLFVGARRDVDDATSYWRFHQFVMPFYAFVPGVFGSPKHCNAWVPIDDETTMVWRIQYRTDETLTPVDFDFFIGGLGAHVSPGGYDTPTTRAGSAWYPSINRSNDYGYDAHRQRSVSFSPVRGIWAQDRATTEGMGPIMERWKEHLASSDVAVIQLRKTLLRSAQLLGEQGTTPPGLDSQPAILPKAVLFLDRQLDWDGIIRSVERGEQLEVEAATA